ncbi:MAG: prepilin-type N-terminal cleavage/methylation domain-containing protein [Burkholderiales bacterium]|nr:prepilin-type N-terminal cleavage/methylation domain-containing protein [Burkholderiales bacterium]
MVNPMRRGKRGGFTLIELLVVMAVLALLLSIAIPRYFNSVDRSREAVLKENLNVIREAIDKFHVDTGRYPGGVEDLVSRKYLRRMPIDPVSERADTWVIVPAPGGDGGMYDVKSGAEGTASDGTAYGDW